MDAYWQKASQRIREQVGPVVFETWFAPLSCRGFAGKTVTLEAPNQFFRDWVKDRYGKLMSEALSTEAGESVELKLVFNREKVTGRPRSTSCAEAEATVSRPVRRESQQQLNQRYTFDEFVVGTSNRFAHAAAHAVAAQPGEKYNPLLIYGGVGLGKTHLVNAIGHHLLANNTSGRPRRVLFMPAEEFMNELISSLRRDRMTEFKEKFRRVDALLLDDVQFLAGRERTQEEFFHTFNSLHSDRHQIVLTSDKMPREIPELEERLRNRFESGLIAHIQPPDLETRVAIIEKKAALDGLQISQEVALYIAQNVSSNVRELEGCLTRLAAVASLNSSAITLEFARQALNDLIHQGTVRPGIEAIQNAVADYFHIRISDLKSKRRTQHIAFCRQVAMYLCRKLTESSFPVIGEHFGRDHSTVIHAYNLIARRVASDAAFRISIEKIARELKAENHSRAA